MTVIAERRAPVRPMIKLHTLVWLTLLQEETDHHWTIAELSERSGVPASLVAQHIDEALWPERYVYQDLSGRFRLTPLGANVGTDEIMDADAGTFRAIAAQVGLTLAW